jgi:hypothetical protein
MFVRRKMQNGRTYHYLVASERAGGRVRQKTIVYLGEYQTLDAALESLPVEIAKVKEEARRCSVKADETRNRMHPAWIERNNAEVPRPRREGCQMANKLFGRYWFYSERAVTCEQRAREMSARLAKLRAACSDHNPHVDMSFLGTT